MEALTYRGAEDNRNGFPAVVASGADEPLRVEYCKHGQLSLRNE